MRVISFNALEVIVKFLYHNGMDKLMTYESLVENVLAIAHMMQIEALIEYCCNSLMGLLNFENFLNIWNLAELYERVEMKKVMARCVSNNDAHMLLDRSLILTFDNNLVTILIIQLVLDQYKHETLR